jgi:fatty-acid desaturase
MSLARVLLAAAVVTQLSIFATTVYLHRVLAHRSLSVRPGVAMVFRVIIWTMTGITPSPTPRRIRTPRWCWGSGPSSSGT